MIIWLASYPRSGNTMFRQMMHRAFGRRTCTKYNWPLTPKDRKHVVPKAPLPMEGLWPEVHPALSRDATSTYMVKTHDAPEGDQKTIYIVRHGLSAIRSYQHYLRDVDKREYSVEDVIMGAPMFGSWGGHLDAWNPLERPHTLVLKYEDLVERPDQELQRVADFTGFAKQAEWVNNFDELHAAEPKVFREGHKVPPEHGFSEEQKQLFWALHGDWMAALGYSTAGPKSFRELRHVLAQRLQSEARSH